MRRRIPVWSVPCGYFERHGQSDSTVHFTFHDLLNLFKFAGGDFDDEFVVDLEEDAGFGVGFFEFVVDAEHGGF